MGVSRGLVTIGGALAAAVFAYGVHVDLVLVIVMAICVAFALLGLTDFLLPPKPEDLPGAQQVPDLRPGQRQTDQPG